MSRLLQSRQDRLARVLSVLLDTFRLLIPLISTLLLALVSFTTLASPTVNLFLPFLVLPASFYWLVHRKRQLPIWSLFVIGILVDCLTAAPVGLTSVHLLLMHFLLDLREQEVANARPWELWLLFALLCAGGLLLIWLIMMVLHWQFLDPSSLLLRGIATVLSYPLVYILLTPLDRLLLGGRD